MKLTIIPSDKLVNIDGVILTFNFTVDSNYHAVHWDGTNGFVETIEGANTTFTDVVEFQAIIDEHANLLAQQVIDNQVIEDARTIAEFNNYPRFLRDEKLYSEINIGGVLITPDDKTQNRIMAARIIAKEDADYTVNWKTNSGYALLDAATIIGLADAIRAHIQKCFDAEKTVSENIGNYSTLEEIGGAYETAYAA